jgi:hypothetical protein
MVAAHLYRRGSVEHGLACEQIVANSPYGVEVAPTIDPVR